MCPGGPMALRRYGELSARAGDNGSDPPRASNGGACVAPGTAVTSTCWLPRSRAAEHGKVLQGEVVPCWLWAMRSRRVDGT
jgi:hypothetical protein